MAHSPADRRRVYLVCKPIFTGNNAQLRKQKKIQELVERRETSLGPLIGDFGIHGVVDILKDLLDKRIFQSETKAKVEFPELFLSSPERDVQRAASENHAAQSEAEALEEITSQDQLDNALDNEDDGDHSQRLAVPGEVAPGTPLVRSTNNELPSLYPSYLPYGTQHIILTTVQRILEESCFDFAERWIPSMLQEKGWECAAAVELTKWSRILAKHSEKLPKNVLALNSPPLNEVLFSTHKLRHSAVHRLPTTARGVNQLIESALRLTETLQDHVRAAQLEELHSEIDSKIKAMELNKNVLESGFTQELQEIGRQREELDRKEERLRAEILANDSENKSLVGSLLEESVRKIFWEAVESHSFSEKKDFGVQKDEEMNGLWGSLTDVSSRS